MGEHVTWKKWEELIPVFVVYGNCVRLSVCNCTCMDGRVYGEHMGRCDGEDHCIRWLILQARKEDC